MNPPRPEDLLGLQLPDLVLQDAEGLPYPVRQHVGHAPLAMIFIIRNGTPG